MHRPNITTPYNSILGTDGWVIWEDTFSNPQSSHVLRHSGMSEREERGLQTPMTLQALQCIHTKLCTRTHMHNDSSKRHLWLLALGQTDFMLDWRMRSKITERCRGQVFLGLLLIQQLKLRGAQVKGQLVTCSCLNMALTPLHLYCACFSLSLKINTHFCFWWMDLQLLGLSKGGQKSLLFLHFLTPGIWISFLSTSCCLAVNTAVSVAHTLSSR